MPATRRLLSKVAKLGLLTKLEKAGLTLRDVGPFLVLAEKNGLIGALGALNDDLLPLLPQVVKFAPLALPIAGTALNVPPPAFYGGAAASVVAALVVTSIPDDNVISVALQTFLAIPLAIVLPAALAGAGFAVGKLNAGQFTSGTFLN
ncbi:hypothetical protein M885DRAFT_511649 [Pelagophyceae sp. CCMP2097]|nr:hypothetical protein M885DRAFT_511649 [Pelagophyceae sp. CCMP2097]